MDYLKEETESKDKQLFVVVTSEVDKNESWLLNKSSYSNHVHLQEREAEVLELRDIIAEDTNVTINPLCNT